MNVVCPNCGEAVTPAMDVDVSLLREGELDPFYCPGCHAFLGVAFIDGGTIGYLTIHDLKTIIAES
ncbi:MAG: hypothetical protein HN909_03615 [Phycisphaerales bacterium]|jgi:hypothetical protein|nr:hypothetical protein [Phycisphaerales bacterium]MBT7170840.1 hypothetical protein [Phycisphaerales bacterium]